MKLNSPKQAIILFSVLIIVLLGLHYVVYRFVRQSDMVVSGLQAEVGLLRAQVAEFSKSSPSDMKNLAQSVMSHFISRTGVAAFIESLERKGKAEGVSVVLRSVDVETLGDEAVTDKEKIRFRFETRGSWSNTMNYLNYIEHLPYKVDLRGLSFSIVAQDGASSNTEWQGQFEIVTLKFK